MSQPSQDQLHRFLFDSRHVRGELVQLNPTYQRMLAGHDYPAVIATLLGEALAATCLLTATLKFEGEITVQIQGSGPLSLLVINGRNDQTMRGIARLQGEVADNMPFQQLIGRGQMVITIVPDQGERYQGVVALEGNTLTACLENYFLRSEQLTTQLTLAADPHSGHCGGLLLQALPGEQQQAADDFSHLAVLAATLTATELFELTAEQLLHRLFHEEEVRLYPAQSVRFHCSCSRQRCQDALRAMPAEELEQLLAEQEEIDIHCHYCNTHHRFTAKDLANHYGQQGQTLH